MPDKTHGLLWVKRILSAFVLIAAGGLHLFLVFDGVGGVVGVLFVLNAIAGIVLGIGMLVSRGKLLQLTSLLSLLFILASFLSLVFALTVGLFGISVPWSFTLVPQTFWIEGIGTVVLASTSVLAFRARRLT
ncbi:hypothetical protein [Cryobacterium sp. CG_9.6]|uniref:hypothetical protein n=1 Tax=Cryobacterium sp. CG_9.6 TaxID=2760710 RepID=UPI002473A1C6|nr:hypothetical protein [Cryobacterium sp. CG_9.6]MDH6237086.1 lysylphosphatidylglycerol synthetase-like protein (DUF2156 family) [Cryobacterium sp. CG_9.6]